MEQPAPHRTILPVIFLFTTATETLITCNANITNKVTENINMEYFMAMHIIWVHGIPRQYHLETIGCRLAKNRS